MNRQEMLERLANGESPLDVSIAKWQDVVKNITAGIDLHRIEYHSATCALCELHFGGGDCPECPYQKHYGHNCSPWNNDTAWTDFDDAFKFNDKVSALQCAKDMVAELEAIKNAQKPD